MNAQELTKALGGRWGGASGMARCPAHDDRDPSFSIRDSADGRLLSCCHAGCSAEAVWAALRDRGIIQRAEPRPSRQTGGRHNSRHNNRSLSQTRPRPAPAPAATERSALEIWRASKPAENTPVEAYLRGRGITIPIPPTIRYHSALLHPDINQHLPALVAAVCNVERKVTGIQRTYLTFTGNKAPLTRPKMALGTLRGGTVRLAPTTDRVWLAEGVEDALALTQMMQEPAWAVLGTAGFKSVEIPASIREVVLAPDGDTAGQAVILETAKRLAGPGRKVRVAKLPAERDWCDLLDDYEERAGILEFDAEFGCTEAEAQARREIIDG